MLRCVCDSTRLEYYLGAALIPLAAWEATEDRPPIATVAMSLSVWVLYAIVGRVPDIEIYLAATLASAAVIAYLGRRALGFAHEPRLRPDGLTVTPIVLAPRHAASTSTPAPRRETIAAPEAWRP